MNPIKATSVLLYLIISLPAVAEVNMIVGGDIMEHEVRLGYAQGNDTFEFEGTRIRFGMESDGGTGFGLEYIPKVSDEAFNVVGTRFRLDIEDSYGAYFTAGSWVYMRLGWSTWLTRYTHIASGISNSSRVSALDYGVGFRVPIGPKLTVYGEYVQKNTNVNFSTFFVDIGSAHTDLSYDSEYFTAGIYYTF